MKIKILAKAVVLTFSLILFLLLSNKVKAQEDECKVQPCFVPAPTIITPVSNATTTNSALVISGLTWKSTWVEVYVDGVKMENVKLVKHADYYASFSVRLKEKLKPGKHSIHTFAYDEKNGWGGVSKESKHVSFFVENEIVKVKPVPTKVSTKPMPTPPQKEDTINNETKTPLEPEKVFNEKPNDKQPVNVPAVERVTNNDQVNNLIETRQNYLEVNSDEANENEVNDEDNQQLGTGATETKDENLQYKKIDDYQQRLKTNRIVGLVILSAIALISLFWLLLKEPIFKNEVNVSLLDKEKNNFESDDKDVK